MVTVLVVAQDEWISHEISRGARRYIAAEGLDWSVQVNAAVMTGVAAIPGQVIVLGWRLQPTFFAHVAERDWRLVELSHKRHQQQQAVTHLVTDNRAIGKAAADYLARLGFRHVLYRRGARVDNVVRDARNEALCSRLHEHGIGSSLADLPQDVDDLDRVARLRGQLQSYAQPVALFCYQDREALWHLNTLQQSGIRIPADLAVLGVDNAPMAAQSRPGLSSVRISIAHMAERAVALMHRQLAGGTGLAAELSIAPAGVHERASTQVKMLAHPIVRRVHRLIEKSLPKGMSVETLARRAKLTPAQLAWYCRQVLDTSPGRWLRRRRLESACDLLLDEELSVQAIAKRCGFVDDRHLARHFKKVYACTPAVFRRGSA